jgi:hypothetical protein
MSRSKKIFFVLAAVFAGLLIYASVDIASRTTFPGSKPQLKQRLMPDKKAFDTLKHDSLPTIHR